MEPEVLLLYSEQPATGLLSKPDESGPHSSIRFLQIHLKLSLRQHLRLLSGRFPSDFSTTTLYDFLFSLVRVTCSVCFVPYNLKP
jgi:hypothetical protein